MVNHPNRRKTYKVWAFPANHPDDTPGCTFIVEGPRVEEFAAQSGIAKIMQRALNSRQTLTERERRSARRALSEMLAGEMPDDWTEADVAAARSAHEKLS